MCGRFTHRYTWKQLHRLMGLTTTGPDQLDLRPSFNVAPTQLAPVVIQDGADRHAEMMRWGLVPFWAKEPSIGNRLINARCEEAAEKPAFRAAMKKRRCLVPVDGFYEWQKTPDGGHKVPWFFCVRDAELFAFAGLWESWGKGAEELQTFTILTAPSNELVRPIHDRMPVIVRPEMYDLWLDPAVEDASAAIETFPAARMDAHTVGARVNRPENNDPSLIQPQSGTDHDRSAAEKTLFG